MGKRHNIQQVVGNRLKNLRNKRNLTLSGLAKRAGISKATLSVLEDGKGNPTISTLWTLADALEIPFGKFVIGVDENRKYLISERGVNVQLIEHSDGPPRIEAYHIRAISSNFYGSYQSTKSVWCSMGTAEHLK